MIDADLRQLRLKVDEGNPRSLRAKASVSTELLAGISSLGLGKAEASTMDLDSGKVLLFRYKCDIWGRDATIYVGSTESLAWLKENYSAFAKSITPNIISMIEF